MCVHEPLLFSAVVSVLLPHETKAMLSAIMIGVFICQLTRRQQRVNRNDSQALGEILRSR